MIPLALAWMLWLSSVIGADPAGGSAPSVSAEEATPASGPASTPASGPAPAPVTADTLMALPLPARGIVYLRYGSPGGVHLVRGNGPGSGRWRDRVRLLFQERDSLAATPRRGGAGPADSMALLASPGGVVDSGAAPWASILREFAADDHEGPLARRETAPAFARTTTPAVPPAVEPRTAPQTIVVVPPVVPPESEPAREAPAEPLREEGDAIVVVPPPTISLEERRVVETPAPVDSVWTPVPLPPTDAVAETPEELTVALVERKVVHTQAILFETDRATLLPGSQPILAALVDFMSSDSLATLTIEGHADARGSDRYNQDLSERRARAVRDALVARGVAADRLSSIGYGETRPLDPRPTLEAYAFNRRVSFRVEPLRP